MATKKTTNKINKINEALDSIDNKGKRIEEINEAIRSNNYGEAVDFIMRFSASQDCKKLIQLLSRITEQPQSFKRKTSFDTLYATAMLDGERNLLRKFLLVVTYANEGDRLMVEKEINRNV